MKEILDTIALHDIELPSGAKFKELNQAYAIYGTPNKNKTNLILVCHALTGGHRLAGEKINGQPDPWWDTLVGDGKTLDTNKFCIICFNNIGSPYGSTSPISINPETGKKYQMDFPLVSPRDIAYAQKNAAEKLGFDHFETVIGGSVGGMIAYEFAISFPESTGKLAVIAAPDKLYPQAIAFNTVQRQAIMNDPEWKNGYYEDKGPTNGLSAARMLAMITYRSEQSFSGRYMREMDEGAEKGWNSKFRVESYLEHHGEALVKRFDANCYLYLTKMMDLHDIGTGRGGVKKAWENFAGKRLLTVGISSDMLFANWQIEEVINTANEAGVNGKYEEIESENGHDAFLIDFDQLDDFLRSFIYNKY
ncbi:MAG: homoserine O-acetyltransferase [Synergistaceae bacterium]